MSFASQSDTKVLSEERRTVPRNRALVGAQILLDNGRSTFDCRIRNQSPLGYLLEMTSTKLIPNAFDLIIQNKPERLRCHVIWRASERLGVRTVTTPVKPSPRKEQPVDETSMLADRLTARFPHLAKK